MVVGMVLEIIDRHGNNEVNASYSRHKSPDYKGCSSHEILCYYYHRPGHIVRDFRRTPSKTITYIFNFI